MRHTYRFTLGDFRCLAVNDGGFVGNAGLLFANAPANELAAELAAAGLDPDHLPSIWTCLLVDTPTHRVLIDTGVGPGYDGGGKLLARLAAEGVAAESIDTVILTHAHGDHIGGSSDEDGALTFPNATYAMWATEWAYWTDPESLAGAPAWAVDVARRKLPPLAPRMRPLATTDAIVPGIRPVPAPGHTVGHMAIELSSGGELLLFLADAALHPLHVTRPDWCARLDQDPVQTAATRRDIYRRAVATDALVLAFHFTPFPSLGRIVAADGGWAWRPTE